MMSLPTWYFFMFLGTCLYVYFGTYSDPAVDSILSESEPEGVLPYFILSQIPAGIAGVVLAAVLAAAMSSLDSIINATATVTIVDIFIRFLVRDHSDAFYLKAARWLAGCYTAAVIGCAISFSCLPKENVADLSLIIGSIFGGCVVAMFLLGFFTTRVDYGSVISALVVAVLVNVYLVLDNFGVLSDSISLGIYSYYTSIIVNVVFAVCAYLAAFRKGKTSKDLTNLTVWTTDRKGPWL